MSADAPTPSPYDTLRYAVDGARATITLSRPEKKNAISPQMVGELLAALAQAHADASVRVLVLRGEGSAFCAGGDFGPSGGASDEAPRGDFADLLRTLATYPKPVIARVHGPAMGGGLGLVAASTFAVASENATLGTPEVNLGLFPMMIMAVLQRAVPRRALLEMMLLGQKLDAARALSYGLLNRVVPPEGLDAAVDALADDLAARSPTAISRGLVALAKTEDLPLGEALPVLRDELYALLGTEDAQEGLQAFFQKRPPAWKGR